MTIQDVLAVLKRVRRQGSGWRACCPVHDDHNPSLSIVEKDGRILLHCHAGCSFDSVRAAILRLGGKDTSRNTEKPSGVVSSPELSVSEDAAAGRPQLRLHGGWADAAGYNYEDDLGRFLFQVVRRARLHLDGTVEKTFRQRRRPRSDDQPAAEEWMYNLDGVPRVLYNLRELGGASLVYVVEGEKDVETLRSIGLVATCNPGGAGKWRAEYNEYLRAKTLVILPDSDEPGRKHAEKVAASPVTVADEVLVIELPNLPPKGDVTDFVLAGGTADDLMDLVERAEPWRPTDEPSTREMANGYGSEEWATDPPSELPDAALYGLAGVSCERSLPTRRQTRLHSFFNSLPHSAAFWGGERTSWSKQRSTTRSFSSRWSAPPARPGRVLRGRPSLVCLPASTRPFIISSKTG